MPQPDISSILTASVPQLSPLSHSHLQELLRTLAGDSAVISVEAAGKVIGLGRKAAYRAAKRGDLPTLRIGRKILVPVASLERKLSEA